MIDPISELIKEIAEKNGTAVSRDDPILVLHTINERLLQESKKAQGLILDEFKEELESIAHRWGEDSKGRAERILNASLTASRESMREVMSEATRSVVDAVKKEVDVSLLQVGSAVEASKRLSLLNITAAILSCAAALIVLWASGRS